MTKIDLNPANAKGAEFCVKHPDGKVDDATLHDPILDNPEAGAASKEIGKAAARRAGLTEDEINKLYD